MRGTLWGLWYKESGKGNDSGNREGKKKRKKITQRVTISHYQLPQYYPETSSFIYSTSMPNIYHMPGYQACLNNLTGQKETA